MKKVIVVLLGLIGVISSANAEPTKMAKGMLCDDMSTVLNGLATSGYKPVVSSTMVVGPMHVLTTVFVNDEHHMSLIEIRTIEKASIACMIGFGENTTVLLEPADK